MSDSDSPDTVVVLNPNSGSGDHAEAVRKRATILGYSVEETSEAGDAITSAREAAANGASTIAAAGGDGTIHEVVRGIDQAEAFDGVTVGVIPVGTGNNFAQNVGVTSLDDAFAVLQDGERRRIDIGRANDRPFVNSCIGGLTAESSGQTTADMKNRLGVLAYILTTLRTVASFEGLRLKVDVYENGTRSTAWSGDAVFVLVGNGRRFTSSTGSQANMEDGRFDVTVVESVSGIDLMSDAVTERLLNQASEYTTRFHAPALKMTVRDPDSSRFSLDGEIVQHQTLLLETEPQTLRIAVGESYSPDPDHN